MKRLTALLVVAAVAIIFTGCRTTGCRTGIIGSCGDCPETCASVCDPCAQSGLLNKLRCRDARNSCAAEPAYAAPAGPAVGAYAYPYYTNRGPRDFLAGNPPSIGP